MAAFGTIQSKSVVDDVGRALAMEWDRDHSNSTEENPWSLRNIARIKDELDADPAATKKKYPEIFYYYDGLIGTKISQSVHPAGMVISPITLPDNFGVFDKDGDVCLVLDMDNIHEYTGVAKYDFLLLQTLQIINDTCKFLGTHYPKTNEIDWDDQDVWDDMIKSPCGLFQFNSTFAFESLRKFAPKNIFEMSIVAACIRPSGASYRDDLLARKVHHNPSPLIDDLLKDNLGYLIYQEDTIKFLQQICGLSGSTADTVRRGIGRKKKEVLDAAMPSILDGYCNKSPQPREIAEKEAREFLQVIEDSASYQFGYNHSVAYCLLGYLCAYYRYYHPMEFLTAFLNNAANDDDIKSGTEYASRLRIHVTMPKWGISKGDYFYDVDKKIISKGLSSIKYIGTDVGDKLYKIANELRASRFTDVLYNNEETRVLNTRQLDVLIKIDFFSEFGNQRELSQIAGYFYDMFRRGSAIQLKKEKVDGTPLEPIVKRHSIGTTKSGGASKSYTLLDVRAIMEELEDAIKSANLPDLDIKTKARNFKEIMGYAGYSSGREEDRSTLYLLDVRPLKRKSDGKQFGVSFITKSIGSGIESRFTVFNNVYNETPVKKDDIIKCKGYQRDGKYFTMTKYEKVG